MGMKKGGRTKSVLSVTIDMRILEEFNKLSAQRSLNKSSLIEKLIKKYLDGGGKDV